MSDTSQGPGWWLASDGKWYPPQPAATPPPAPPGPPAPPMGGAPMGGMPMGGAPMGGMPMGAPMAPPAKKGMSGAAKGCLIAFVIVFVLGAGAVIAGLFFVGKAVDTAVGGIGNCPIISSEQAQQVLGPGYSADELKGLLSLGNVALDTRVLPDDQRCWITKSGITSSPQQSTTPSSGRIVTVARYEGGEAQTRFANELAKAGGTKEDKGGGLSVETMGYFLKTVELGDEAFCTSSDLIGSSGVLVRKGTTLVYVATTPEDFEGAGLPGGSTWDEDNCTTSIALAKKALGI